MGFLEFEPTVPNPTDIPVEENNSHLSLRGDCRDVIPSIKTVKQGEIYHEIIQEEINSEMWKAVIRKRIDSIMLSDGIDWKFESSELDNINWILSTAEVISKKITEFVIYLHI